MTARAEQNGEFTFATDLIQLGVELGHLQEHYAVVQFARIVARAAATTSQRANLTLTPDDVARRFLEATALTPKESIDAATRRRKEILTDPDAVIHPGQDISKLDVPADPQIERLAELEEMISAIAPLLARVQDKDVSRKVGAWLDLSNRWEIGEEAASVARRRLSE